MNKTSIFSKKEKRKALRSGIISASGVAAGYISFLFVMQILANLVSEARSKEYIIGRLIIIFLLLTIKVVFSSIALSHSHKNAFSVLANIRLRLIKHMRSLSLSFFKKRKIGDLSNIVNHDVEQVELYVGHALPDLILSSTIPLLIFTFVTFLDWRLGLCIISSLPLIFIFFSIFNKALKPFSNKYAKDTKELNEEIIEYISSITVIKAFNKSEKKTKQVLGKMEVYEKWLRKISVSISAYGGSILAILQDVGLIITIIVGSTLLFKELISTNIFIISVVMSIFFNTTLTRLMKMHHSLMTFNTSKSRINSILSEKPVNENKKTDSAKINNGEIQIKNLSYSYEETEVLRNINLKIKKYTTTALIGSSGSGKTTLAHILLGFVQSYNGSVTINNVEISNIKEEDLTPLVSIVQQDVFLFNTSIRENIALGKKNATEQELFEVIKKAQLTSLITSLPNGLDTIVGEGGAKLSGGEKQRISIARVMLKDSPIIILDEATSAIDPHNEFLIHQAIRELRKNRTLIIIAHNMHTIVDSDQIVLLEDGETLAQGTHNELITESETYVEMFSAQNEVDRWTIKKETKPVF